MKTLQDTRAKNLKTLIAEAGSQAKLADRIGVSASVVSQLSTGHRSIGEKLARKIETSTGRPLLWLDQGEVVEQPESKRQAFQELLDTATTEELREMVGDLEKLKPDQVNAIKTMIKTLLHSPK